MKSLSVTIQMRATEQYFSLVLFVMWYKLVSNMNSEDEILKCGRSLLNLWKMILTIPNDSNETLKYNHSNEICGVVLLFVFSQSE